MSLTRLTQSIPDHAAGILPGDCWRTAIACIVEAPSLEGVPHFAMLGDDWWEATRRWVRSYDGRNLLAWDPVFPLYVDEGWPYLVASGPSPRGDWLHAVVVSSRDGSLVWDPHPSRAGLAGDPVDVVGFG